MTEAGPPILKSILALFSYFVIFYLISFGILGVLFMKRKGLKFIVFVSIPASAILMVVAFFALGALFVSGGVL